jgi:hypothetical protein
MIKHGLWIHKVIFEQKHRVTFSPYRHLTVSTVLKSWYAPCHILNWVEEIFKTYEDGCTQSIDIVSSSEHDMLVIFRIAKKPKMVHKACHHRVRKQSEIVNGVFL